jgi:hypothetical protein
VPDNATGMHGVLHDGKGPDASPGRRFTACNLLRSASPRVGAPGDLCQEPQRGIDRGRVRKQVCHFGVNHYHVRTRSEPLNVFPADQRPEIRAFVFGTKLARSRFLSLPHIDSLPASRATAEVGQAIGSCGLSLPADDSRQKPIDCPTSAAFSAGAPYRFTSLEYSHPPLCYTTFLWQASPSRGIITISPRDGRCNNFH